MYNWLIENFLFPIADVLLRTNFMQEIKKWRKYDTKSIAEIQKIQLEKLGILLKHALKYNQYYSNIGVEYDDDPVLTLKKLPVLTKEKIQNNLLKIIDGEKSKLVCEKSSGSSGIQGEVYMSKKEAFASIAAQTYLWEWAGYKLGDRILQLGMTIKRGKLKAIKDVMLRTDYQPAFQITSSIITKILQKYKNKSAVFGGYASGLFLFAQEEKKSGTNKVKFKSVISWGDKMFDHYRELIENQFGCKVYDIYGSTEGLVIAGQCELGSYHILSPHVFIEILDKNGEDVKPGQLGYVVATRLDAFKMPLIRYYLGDLAIKASDQKKCACGRPYPLLEKIIGRDTDIVSTPSGKQLIVHFFTGIFEHLPEIKQFKVIQNEINSMVIEYIPNWHLFTENTIADITKILHEKIGEPFPVVFSQVENIEPSPSGKPQIIESRINSNNF